MTKRLPPVKPPKPQSTIVEVAKERMSRAFDAPEAAGELRLDANEILGVQLGNERIINAQLHLQNRKNEFDQLVVQLRAKYEEGGKFVMTSLDISQGVIVRRPK